MISKGTMRPLKKVLGGVLIASTIGMLLLYDKTMSLIVAHRFIAMLLLAVSGYFLFISGRQL